jgi:hypothetical protein
MIDIVKYFKEKVDVWNAENKCGLCFDFAAPLFNSEINIQQTENCCVNVFLTNINVRTNYTETNFGIVKNDCIISFDLFFLVKKPLGTNNYNEVTGYPITESKWEKIFKPLLNCFGTGENVCENIDGFKGYINYNATLVQNYLDETYQGLKIRADIKIK